MRDGIPRLPDGRVDRVWAMRAGLLNSDLPPLERTGFRAELEGPWLYSKSPWKLGQSIEELLGWACTIDGCEAAYIEETFNEFPYRRSYQIWTRSPARSWREWHAADQRAEALEKVDG